MPARTHRGTSATGWADNVRQRIKTSMLINRLQDHALGIIELSATQIKSIEILIRKVLPDLAAVDLSGNVDHSFVAALPETIKRLQDWQEQNGRQTLQ